MTQQGPVALVGRAELAGLLARALGQWALSPPLSPQPQAQQPSPWALPPQQPPPSWRPPPAQAPPTVPARLTVLAFLPETLAPLAGARVAVWLKYADGSQERFAEGFTDAEGAYAFDRQVPVRLTPAVHTPGGPAFPQPGRDVPMLKAVVSPSRGELRGASMAQATPDFQPVVLDNIKANVPVEQTLSAVACPPGTDALVCAAARAQRMWKDIYDQQVRAWGNSPQAQSHAADQAHANVRLGHPELQANWPTFTWWIGDLAIPPKDWPDLVKWSAQAGRVFASVPFPRLPGAEDLFQRCSRGLPVWKGVSLASPRLYSRTWSDYFPRSDRQIEMDLAAVYLVSLPAVFGCIEHRLKAKAREIERSRKTFAILGLATTFMLGPMAGGSFPGLIITDLAETMLQLRQGEAKGYNDVITKGVSTASELAQGNMAAIGAIVAAGLGLLVSKWAPDLDPTVRGLAQGAVGELAGSAASDLLGGATPTAGAADFLSLQAAGSAAAALAVKLVSSAIKAQGVRGVEGLRDAVLGLNQLPELMIPFQLWVLKTLLLGALLEAAAKDAGLGEVDAARDIAGPEADRAAAAGVEVPGARRTSPAAGAAVGGGAAVGLLALIGAFGQL